MLHDFDIFSLNETFVCLDQPVYALFADYDLFIAKAVKLSYQGRFSGGVLVFVRKTLSRFIKKVETNYNHIIVLNIDKRLLGTTKNVFLICLYVHPYDSKYWEQSPSCYGMEVLEQCLIDLYENFNDFHIIICGDLNARTGCNNTVLCDDFTVNDNFKQTYLHTTPEFTRFSDDKEITQFGKELLSICSMFNCIIVNGLVCYDFDDSLTYVCNTGGSMIDYFITSSDLFLQQHITSLSVLPSIDSSHFPVSMTLSAVGETCIKSSNTLRNRRIYKRIWNKQLENDFIRNIQCDELTDLFMRATDIIDFDVNRALEVFVQGLLRASDCMVKQVFAGNNFKAPSWFDGECFRLKQKVRCFLTKFKKSKLDEDRKNYVVERSKYKLMIRNKKSKYKREKARQLASFGKDSKSFWKNVRQLSDHKRTGLCGQISNSMWLDYFKELFDLKPVASIQSDHVDQHAAINNLECQELNKRITDNDVTEAVLNLKNNKACGIDDIKAEMLKLAGIASIGFMTKLFNVIFDNGIYPEEWRKAIIVPIFKKGDPSIADNYRGVSLLSVMSKCYTFILNKRLSKWVKTNLLLTETQAGFRKGYSTVDHIFTLNAIVEKCLSKKKGKLYVCFVDLKKAFDSVQRETLFKILLKTGINGKFINAIKAIYTSVFSCVRVEELLTDSFSCPLGLRQGCILSPTLFSIFINEIALILDEKGLHGIQMVPGLIELFILLFADDLVLLSNTVRGLQNQINVLSEACKQIFLEINKDKTKIMVFRKGGFLSKNEKWILDGNYLEIVNEYNYLGFLFTTRMSLNRGVDALAVKARRACVECIKHISRLNDISKACFFKIFDSQVQSVAMYAAEVWGLNRFDSIERVHTLACKRFLKVPLKLPNKFIYGELGRHPLYINSAVRCLKYWFKILKMDMSRLPRQAYAMLLSVDASGKACWASLIKNTLFRLGFGHVWINQGVGSETKFICVFKQRLLDHYTQEWYSSLLNKDIFNVYKLYKFNFQCERYFEFLNIRCFRDCYVKLRTGVLPINGCFFRKTFGNELNARCVKCNSIEDEIHFIHECPLYDIIRTKYVQASNYISIISHGSVDDIRNLASFILHALRARQLFVENE